MSNISSKHEWKELRRKLGLNDSIKLPFPLPDYGVHSEGSADKYKNTDDEVVLITNSLSPTQKCILTKTVSCEDSEPQSKSSTMDQPLPTKKDNEITPTHNNEENNAKKISISLEKKKTSSFIGAYTPDKMKVNSNIHGLSTESTSKDNTNKTIIEGSAEFISTNFMNDRDLHKTPNKIKILNNKTLVGKEVIPLQILTEMHNNKSIENVVNNNISNADGEKKLKAFVKKEEECNPCVLDFATKILKYVGSHKSLQKLLTGKEVIRLRQFLELPQKDYRIFCVNLYSRKKKWYNIFELRTKVKLQMFDREVMDMYTCLSNHGFVDTDYTTESIGALLGYLHVKHIKDICSQFKLRLLTDSKKSTMIEKLKSHCNIQSTFKYTNNNIDDIMMEKIKEKMGHRVRINLEFYNILHKVHLLYKFVIKDYQKVNDLYIFLRNIRDGKITMPEIKVNENYAVFSSITDFSSFQKSLELEEEVLTAIDQKHANSIVYELCNFAYEKLKVIVESNISDDRPACVQRFTPGYQYTNILSTGLKYLMNYDPNKVSEWLHFLLRQNKYCKNLIGSWYNTVIKIQYNYLKQPELAISTLVKALQEKNLSKIDYIELNARAEQIKHSQTNKISHLQFGQISSLQPILMEDFPFITIDAKAIRSDVSEKKRGQKESETSLENVSVEEVALEYYYNSFANGLHCEGSLLVTTFFVLFWDIIYGDKVSFAFISEIQYYPLDLMSKEFYTNRKEDICKRLSEIEVDWSLEKLKDFVWDIWTEHSSKKSFINAHVVDESEQLFDILLCIGRPKLRNIMEHLAIDFESYHSGLPDLFLWNVREKKCKFVEVIVQGGKLTSTQKCWLDFLRSIDADIEVCSVQNTTFKRKLGAIKNENSDKVKTPKKQKT